MSHTLTFARRYEYGPSERIEGPVVLQTGTETMELLATLDTGADHCLFERECADLLGIDVESGQPQAFQTAAGGFRAFAHPVSISVLGVQFESVVYFFADPAIKKNVLDRKGWLDRFRVGLVHYKSTLFLSHHDD